MKSLWQEAEVLDDFLGFPVTPVAIDVLEGRQCSPGDALGRPHHALESPVVADVAFAIPGGDTARPDALNGASVKVKGQSQGPRQISSGVKYLSKITFITYVFFGDIYT